MSRVWMSVVVQLCHPYILVSWFVKCQLFQVCFATLLVDSLTAWRGKRPPTIFGHLRTGNKRKQECENSFNLRQSLLHIVSQTIVNNHTETRGLAITLSALLDIFRKVLVLRCIVALEAVTMPAALHARDRTSDCHELIRNPGAAEADVNCCVGRLIWPDACVE